MVLNKFSTDNTQIPRERLTPHLPAINTGFQRSCQSLQENSFGLPQAHRPYINPGMAIQLN